MQVLILFLALSFVFGGRAARRGRPDRTLWILSGCMFVTVLLSAHRFS